MHQRDQRLIRAGLADIRRRRRYMWVLLLGFLPFGVLVSLLPISDSLVPWLAFGWLGVFAIASIRSNLSKCPRCGRNYHQFMIVFIPWSNKCGSCGLALNGGQHA